MSFDLYQYEIDLALSTPTDSRDDLANRMHHARVAMRVAPTPGKRHFARTQFLAARRSLDRLILAKRPPWKSPLIAGATAAISAALTALLLQVTR